MEEVTNSFGEMSPSCAGYAAVLLNLLTSFLFPAGKARELSEDAVVTLYSWETELVQTLAGAGAVTTIPTAEGDGLVMGLLDRRAKFCVLVRRTTWALSFDPGAVKEQNLQQYGVLSSLKPKAFQTGKAQ